MTTNAVLNPCVDCKAATTRERCSRCEKALERATAVPFTSLSLLAEPEQWHQCPRCGKEYALEMAVQCWDCDKAVERAAARTAALERAGLRGWHAKLEAEHPRVLALFGVRSPEVLRGRVSALLHARTDVSGITLTGAAGAGKSTLAVLLAKARLSGALFVRTLTLVEAVDQHPLGDHKQAELLTRAKTVPVLILDELTVPAVGQRKQMIQELVFDRVDGGKLTIITHGYEEQEILRDWGAGMHRRLYVDAQHIHLLCPTCGHEAHKGACSAKVNGQPCPCAKRAEAAS